MFLALSTLLQLARFRAAQNQQEQPLIADSYAAWLAASGQQVSAGSGVGRLVTGGDVLVCQLGLHS